MNKKQIGRNVKRARLTRGLTQDDVCVKASVSQPALSYIEGGWRDARLSTLLAIAAAIGCPAAEFFEEAENDT